MPPATTTAFSLVFATIAFFLLAAPLSHDSGEVLHPERSTPRAIDVRHALPFDEPAVHVRVDSIGVTIAGEEYALTTLGADCAEAVQNVSALHGRAWPLALDVAPRTPAWVVLTVMRECERTNRPVWLVVRS